MSYVVTATHPISITGGRIVAPGEEVKNLKANDPRVAALVEAGSLRKKRSAKPKPAPSAETEEPTPAPETTTETEN